MIIRIYPKDGLKGNSTKNVKIQPFRLTEPYGLMNSKHTPDFLPHTYAMGGRVPCRRLSR